jgi:hypothetical protein
MAILIDYSQVFISNIIKQLNMGTMEIEEDLVRHTVLNTLRFYRTKFKDEYGEIIICCDNRKYWRRDLFKYYKAHRKKAREESDIDWNALFGYLNKIKQEIKDNFPYIIMEVQFAEADDIIAILSEHITAKNVIVSSDKDFGQLTKFSWVNQYSPTIKDFIVIENPNEFKREHIMKGDRGDGIPNFLSSDSCLVDGIRQTPINYRKIDNWKKLNPEIFCDRKMLKGYKRNQKLVDFDFIPENIKQEILNEYISYLNNDRSKIFDYFIANNLKYLMEQIGEF